MSELVGLRPQDLNLDGGYLTRTGKGDKQRIVPIGDEAARWVTRYLHEARPALLGTRARRRACSSTRAAAAGLTRVGFWKILKGYAQAGRPRARSSVRTCCAIRLRRTCSSAAPTCARSR